MDTELYLLALFIPAVVGALIALLPFSKVKRKNFALTLCCISCIAGILAYPVFLLNGTMGYSFPVSSAWGDYAISLDDLSSLMISFSSIVFLAVTVHMFRSKTASTSARYYGLTCLLFIVCALTMCADSVFLILLAWEMVTLITFMMSYGSREGPRWRFFVIAHLGGLMVISAFVIMYIYAGTPSLSSWSNLNSAMGFSVSCGVIALLFIGFGTKLGLVPFHVWMPDLYSEAPTHTTTLLTTVCSNVAVLVLFKSVFEFVGITDGMHGIAILMIVLSSVTMIWGALESIIQTEAKRILAYSSMENMAIVVLCFSIGILFASSGYTGLTVLILVAGILHTINHSVFKSLMLLTVGTVEDSTGTTSMEKLGGLSKFMPILSMVALIAVLSMAAIPPFNGFMSEWLVLQSIMNGDTAGVGEMELILPVIVAVFGVSGMLAAVSYARMYGFIFLGRPRSSAVHESTRLDKITIMPMVMLAGACLALGLFAIPIIDTLANSIHIPTSLTSDTYESYLSSSLNLPLLSALILIMILILYGLNKIFKKNIEKTNTWGCGAKLEGEMQYSSMGFTQPLVKVFHPLYGDVAEITDEGNRNKHFSLNFKEPFVTYLYEPLGKTVSIFSRVIGKMQNGNLQTYLAYILATLVVLLVVVRLI